MKHYGQSMQPISMIMLRINKGKSACAKAVREIGRVASALGFDVGSLDLGGQGSGRETGVGALVWRPAAIWMAMT